jgi:AcrR family transcriptional regulator
MATADGRAEANGNRLDGRALPRGPYAIRPEYVAADQRRRLLTAVPLVIAEHGFEDATVDRFVKAAAVKRNAFYEQFENKRECVAAAYEEAQERILGAVTYQCYAHADPATRVGSALRGALDLLAAESGLARLVILDCPCAGGEIATRHHEWLDRYGRMLRFATVGAPGVRAPSAGIEPAIVGGIFSRVKEMLLAGKATKLAELAPELTAFALSFYALPEPGGRFTDREPPQLQSSDGDAGVAAAAVA